MALGMNDFRSIVIKADAANTSIAPIRLSQNDQDGRRIVFELWNGAESISATGLTARLLFGVGEGGYATMTAVSDAATATWAVDVPQEALQTAGVVRMAVEVASGSQAVCTRIFDAVVEPALIDEESPEAQDALSEFREAVARLEDFTVPVPIANGGTGATTAANARTALGITPTNIGAFPTTGGTLTGNEYIKSNNLQNDVRPSQNTSGVGIQFRDKNNTMFGAIGPRFYSDGTQTVQWTVERNVNGTNVINAIVVGVDESGNRYYGLNDPKAWQKMLGMSAAQIAKDYSWTTTFTGSSCLVTISRGSYFAVGIIDYWSTGMNVIMQSTNVQNAGLPTIVKSANSYSFTITNDHNNVAIAVEVISIPMETVG